MKKITTNKAPAVVGPYSQAIEANGFIYCSGQIGIDPSTSNLEDGIINQTKKVLNNLAGVLTEAGSDLKHVVKTTVFLKNMSDYVVMNEVYEAAFDGHKPARATVEVSNLPKGALVEIEAVAVKKE